MKVPSSTLKSALGTMADGATLPWVRIAGWVVATLLGALQAVAYRYSISTEDLISYLDVGDAFLRGDWDAAINGYWSPLYPMILGVATAVLKPNAFWEFPTVKLVNFLIYLFALGCFEILLRQLFIYRERRIKEDAPGYYRIPQWCFLALGYTMFLWAALNWTTLRSDTPDQLTSAFVYLAAAVVLRLGIAPGIGWRLLLGAILGFAYLSKMALFPISFVFIAVSAVSANGYRRRLIGAAATLLTFSLVCAPFIVPLSVDKGRFTFGEVGKIAYAVLIYPGILDKFWQGENQTGVPRHLANKIFEAPVVYEFQAPFVAATYPPWYDPSYWHDGLELTLNFPTQIRVLAQNFVFYYDSFLKALLFTYLVVLSVSGSFRASLRELLSTWRLLALALAGLGAYAVGTTLPLVTLPSQPSTRYIASFMVLVVAAAFISLRLPDTQTSKRIITAVTAATLVVIGLSLAFDALHQIDILRRDPYTNFYIAQGLQKMGLKPGDRIAQLNHDSYAWARLARFRIIAEVPFTSQFWNAEPQVRRDILSAMRAVGVKAIVKPPGEPMSEAALMEGWRQVGMTDCYVRFLEPEPTASDLGVPR
jgi:hypothetical protein